MEQNKTSCFGCKHCSAGRWSGWSCRLGVPGTDDEDYSCWAEDEDKAFWKSREQHQSTGDKS